MLPASVALSEELTPAMYHTIERYEINPFERGASCHSCKCVREVSALWVCSNKCRKSFKYLLTDPSDPRKPIRNRRPTQCRSKYCTVCLQNHYGIEAGSQRPEIWHCPSCTNQCKCKKCMVERGQMVPTERKRIKTGKRAPCVAKRLKSTTVRINHNKSFTHDRTILDPHILPPPPSLPLTSSDLAIPQGQHYFQTLSSPITSHLTSQSLMTPMHFGPEVEQLSNDLLLLSEQAQSNVPHHKLKRKFDFEEERAIQYIANQLEERIIPQTPKAFKAIETSLMTPLDISLPPSLDSFDEKLANPWKKSFYPPNSMTDLSLTC